MFGSIREIFEVFDQNGDKALDASELKQAFACMVFFTTFHLSLVLDIVLSASVQGKELSKEELDSIIKTHDLDHNGVFDEVMMLLNRCKIVIMINSQCRYFDKAWGACSPCYKLELV